MNYEIKIIPVGYLETNCYLLISGDGSVLIDPGDEADRIIPVLNGKKPDVVLLTHAHSDHIGALKEIKEIFPSVVIMAHPLELPALADPMKNLSYFEDKMIISPSADKTIEDGSIVSIGKIKLKVLHTPGHTAGSVCFSDDKNKIVFTGDTFFKGTIGRVDLPGGNEDIMMRSIRYFIKEMSSINNDDVVIYPGHGPSTTLSWEKEYNPYFRL